METAFSGTLHVATGSVILYVTPAVTRLEITSYIDDDKTAPIDDADLERNEGAYL